MNTVTRRHDDGFVLLMALVLLMVVSLVMAGMVRASLDRALHARSAMRELQWRWGQLSCHNAMLGQADSLFNAQQANPRLGRPTSAPIPAVVTLGEMQFRMLLSDESTKINVNVMAEDIEIRTLHARIRNILQRASIADVSVRLNPLRPEQTGQAASMPLAGYGHLFQAFDATPQKLLRSYPQMHPIGRNFTCWGQGKLNFRRASKTALNEVCRGWLDATQINRLHNLIKQYPHYSAYDALRRLGIDHVARRRLMDRLSEESSCYSIWMVVDDGSRIRYRLVVALRGAPNYKLPNDAQQTDSMAMMATASDDAPGDGAGLDSNPTSPGASADSGEATNPDVYTGPINSPEYVRFHARRNRSPFERVRPPLPTVAVTQAPQRNGGQIVPSGVTQVMWNGLHGSDRRTDDIEPEPVRTMPQANVTIVAEFEW